MLKFSFVIPCYNSVNTLKTVVTEIQEVIKKDHSYEIILVNDSSPDDVQTIIDELCIKFSNIHGILLSKNFGKHSALMAGFRESCGENVCFLDDDGQCPFSEFYKLFDKIEEGYPVAMAYYGKKKQNAFKNFGSILNNFMAQILIDKPKDLQLSNFVLIKQFVIKEMIKYTGPYPYVDGLYFWITKNIAPVLMEDRHRLEGETSFTFIKLLKLWLNGFTSFSIVPLRITTFIGFSLSLLGFGIIIYLGINKLISSTYIPEGWTSLIATIILIGGLNLFMLGVLGEYVGRTFLLLNNTPQYVISKKSTNSY